MVVLALEYGNGPILLKEIAERQHLPTTYLEQLMVPLRKARLVTATRGINGGYILMRSPQEISLADVIQVLEGPLELVDCTAVANCNWHQKACALKSVLTEASELLIAFFTSISLADLAQKQLEQNPQPGLEALLSYNI
jgi:Rrf2 family protein